MKGIEFVHRTCGGRLENRVIAEHPDGAKQFNLHCTNCGWFPAVYANPFMPVAMTVGQLKEILRRCSDDAYIEVVCEDGFDKPVVDFEEEQMWVTGSEWKIGHYGLASADENKLVLYIKPNDGRLPEDTASLFETGGREELQVEETNVSKDLTK